MPGGDTAACHQKTCSLVPPCMEPVDINQSLLSRFLEDGRRSRQVGRVRGHFPPLEGPWRQLRNQAGALQRSHGGGARGISSWAGAASAVVEVLATLLVHLGPNGRAAVRLWANKYSRIGAGFIIVRRPLSRCTNPSTLSPTFRCEIKKTTAIVEFDQGDKNSAPMLIKSI